MRVLYVAPLDPVALAAPGYHIANVVNELIKLGHEVVVLHQGTKREEILAPQIALELPRSGLVQKLRSAMAFSRAIKQELRENDYDVIIHRLGKWCVLPFGIYRKSSLPVILEVNADVHAELKSQNRNYLVRQLYSLSEKYQVSRSRWIHVVAKGIGVNFQRNHPKAADRVVVIENGAEVERHFPRDRDECCQELGLDPSLRYVTYGGSLQLWQGLETIVECAPKVLAKRPNTRFLIVGDGACRKALESQISKSGLQDKVLLPGWQTGDRLATYLGASDVCLAPYSSLAGLVPDDPNLETRHWMMKCSPLKIYTYMAMGRPVVASDFADGGRRLLDWDCGLAFPPDDALGLAEQVLKLLEDPALAARLGKNGRARVVEHHTWTNVAKKLEALFSRPLPKQV